MYLALYRKWRPKTFEDVVGQEHITKTLKNEVLLNQLAHAYLFTGSRGTGKTTCSKILAKAVNCLHPVNGNPCLQCENCRAIEDGTMLDVVEMDAASNNGVNDVRLLREEANYTPAQGKYRVYIIDETHMLSTAAFNALLKTMEEPPPHVIFILATTEAHKVPATILSRCQRFDFVRIKTDDIAKRLAYIAEEEGFALTKDAAHLIARLADGGMRDAISIMDQCTSYSREVTTEVVSSATGLVLQDYLFDLVDVLRRQSASEAIQKIDELYEGSKDLQKLLGDLVNHYRNLMIARTVPNPAELINCLPEDLVRIKKQAQSTPLAAILYSLTVLQDTIGQMSRGYGKRLAAEMAMIKLCTPSLDTGNAALITRIERLEQQIRSGITIASEVSTQEKETAAKIDTQIIETEVSNNVLSGNETVSTTETLIQKNAELPSVSTSNVSTDASHPTGKADSSVAVPFDGWDGILAELQEKDPAICGMLIDSKAYTVSGNVLILDCPNAMVPKVIKQKEAVKQLKALLLEKTGIQYRVLTKKTKEKPKTEDPLQSLLTDARKIGIEIDSK